jgi:hypothetical protein
VCDLHAVADTAVSRRAFLAGMPVAAAGLALPQRRPAVRAVEVAPGLGIVPRSEWAPDLVPTGPVPDEPDVRFLLVHHSVNANGYDEDQVIGLLRSIHRFHTGERGWPDIAYNFFVDRFGRAWEGRTGSIERPKAGDATGGSQGFAQLCCFLGDHSVEPPTAAAQATMGTLLGWLADRSQVDLSPGATTGFVSRGSNLHPAGTTVTTPTLAGHRDMSRTACPGDAAQGLVLDGTLARLAAVEVQPPPEPATTAPTTVATEAPTSAAPTTAGSTTAPTTQAPGTGAAAQPGGTNRQVGDPAGGGDGGRIWQLGSGLAIAAAALAATIVRRRQVLASRRDGSSGLG